MFANDCPPGIIQPARLEEKILAQCDFVPEMKNDLIMFRRQAWHERSWLQLLTPVRFFESELRESTTICREHRTFAQKEREAVKQQQQQQQPKEQKTPKLPAAAAETIPDGPVESKTKTKRKSKTQRAAAAAAAALLPPAPTSARSQPDPKAKAKSRAPTPPREQVPPLALGKVSSGVSGSKPRAGYTCHTCGVKGGLETSHWKMFCPKTYAGGATDLTRTSPRRTPPASPRGSSSARSSGSSRSSASAGTATTTSSVRRERGGGASAGKGDSTWKTQGKRPLLAPGSLPHIACKFGAECRKWAAGTCAYGHSLLDCCYDLDNIDGSMAGNSDVESIKTDIDDGIVSNLDTISDSDPDTSPNQIDQIDSYSEDGSPGSFTSDYFDGVSDSGSDSISGENGIGNLSDLGTPESTVVPVASIVDATQEQPFMQSLPVDLREIIRGFIRLEESRVVRLDGSIKLTPFTRDNFQIDRRISFTNDAAEISNYEIESGNRIGPYPRGPRQYKRNWLDENSMQIHMLKSKFDRNGHGRVAHRRAAKLAELYKAIPMLVSSIMDTGAGVHLKCYASDISNHEIEQLNIMSANGKVSSDRGTKLKLKQIGNQEFVVLANTPNVLSVGVLIEQGYTFYWTPNSTKVEHRVGHCSLTHTILPSSSTGLCKSNYQDNSTNPLPSK